MLLEPVWNLFKREVFSAPSTDRLFNLYRDVNQDLDRPDAAEIRRTNLYRYLEGYKKLPPVLVLAEAPGPRGCRFSGVPFVSEAQLLDDTFPIHGYQSSACETPHAEYSGGIFWRVLEPYFPGFFVWNSVPYHPHKTGQPLSIRNPTNREVIAFGAVLSELLRILKPACILAVGRKAEHAFRVLNVECLYIRHPSQGGARHFELGISEVARHFI